jgi:hypothetical protein
LKGKSRAFAQGAADGEFATHLLDQAFADG